MSENTMGFKLYSQRNAYIYSSDANQTLNLVDIKCAKKLSLALELSINCTMFQWYPQIEKF